MTGNDTNFLRVIIKKRNFFIFLMKLTINYIVNVEIAGGSTDHIKVGV